jgi:hypothetical protein
VEGRHKESYRHKLFTNYDKIDYSSKTLLELQSQLQTHLTIFRASVNSYLEEYKEAWNAPSNFNTQAASDFILLTLKQFDEINDQVSSRLTSDLMNIIRG